MVTPACYSRWVPYTLRHSHFSLLAHENWNPIGSTTEAATVAHFTPRGGGAAIQRLAGGGRRRCDDHSRRPAALLPRPANGGGSGRQPEHGRRDSRAESAPGSPARVPRGRRKIRDSSASLASPWSLPRKKNGAGNPRRRRSFRPRRRRPRRAGARKRPLRPGPRRRRGRRGVRWLVVGGFFGSKQCTLDFDNRPRGMAPGWCRTLTVSDKNHY
jgi:hypothetical protein